MGTYSQLQAINNEESSEEKQPRGKWNKSRSSQDVNSRGGDRDPTRGKQNTKIVWFWLNGSTENNPLWFQTPFIFCVYRYIHGILD